MYRGSKISILSSSEIQALVSTALHLLQRLIKFTVYPGKTTIARLYVKYLASIGILSGSVFVEVTGSKLAQDGISGLGDMLDKIIKGGGGAMFVDEAYQLTDAHNFGGRPVLDLLLTKMLDHVGTIIFLFAGYNKNMEAFFQANPGLSSRIPHRFQFEDYDDSQLLAIFTQKVAKTYNNRMKLEDGPDGVYARIAVRRVGRSRGRPGFGNARAISNMVELVEKRQAERINKDRRSGYLPDDFMIQKQDLIGPDPKTAVVESKALNELQDLIGLNAVKASVKSLIDTITANYERELKELKPMEFSLNRVFLGNPGTGKTTVAAIYGQILADFGVLSNGEGKYSHISLSILFVFILLEFLHP